MPWTRRSPDWRRSSTRSAPRGQAGRVRSTRAPHRNTASSMCPCIGPGCDAALCTSSQHCSRHPPDRQQRMRRKCCHTTRSSARSNRRRPSAAWRRCCSACTGCCSRQCSPDRSNCRAESARPCSSVLVGMQRCWCMRRSASHTQCSRTCRQTHRWVPAPRAVRGRGVVWVCCLKHRHSCRDPGR